MSTILHSKIIGTGTPILILHGFLGMSDNWKTLGAKYAEQGFQTHLIDQRNHGKSFHSVDFNYDFLSKDILSYIDDHNLQKVSIIGHSMGGKTAMQFACDYSDRMNKLLVADISPKFYPPHHQEIINGLQALDFEEISSRKEADLELTQYISEFGVRQFLLKNLYWIEKEKLGFRFNLPILSTKMEEIGENINDSAQFEGPTLFLKGDASEYVSETDLPAIKRHFPAATIETISNAGHWVHAANPIEFFEKSLAFLRQ